ncbi:hypothetical protein KY361_04010 [Candidatus Woesearchaeota archaeon]|nr:hypothetical protein [Candidatus Woesearchaeota archaeon]
MDDRELNKDTVPIHTGKVDETVARRKYEALESSIKTRLEERLGTPALEAAGRIREGTHTLDDVFLYQGKLRELFSEGYLPRSGDETAAYPELASDIASIIISDFETCLKEGLVKGRTYELAVRNVNNIGNKSANFLPSTLTSDLRNALYGKDGSDYNAPFPGLLTTLWALRELRPTTYYNSLNAAKWAVLIGEAVNAYNSSQGIELRVDTRELFMYALVQNAGMLDPDIPLVDSDKALGGKEKFQLVGHGQKSVAVLKDNLFSIPESGRFENVLTFHTHPKVYCGNLYYDDLTATLIGISSTAEMFEGMYFKKAHRKAPMTPDEVFSRIEQKMFTEEELDKIKDTLKLGYRYDAEQAKRYPLLQPYAMLCLAFGKLERN